MKNTTLAKYATIAAFCNLVPLSSIHAEGVVDKADKSGTNPIAFTYDARIYNEYQHLDLPGDAHLNVTTFEFRAPIAGGKWQFRTRLTASDLEVDKAGVDESGVGDMNFRFLSVPYMNMKSLTAVAVGLEVFLPTGDDILSTNAYTLGPQAFFVVFKPLDGLVDLIAPGYQHQFSVYEQNDADKVHLGLIDFFVLKMFNNKQQWLLLDPQGIINYEQETEWVQFDVEVGTMLPIDGHSLYVRPSAGMGSDAPYDYSCEVGYKIIW